MLTLGRKKMNDIIQVLGVDLLNTREVNKIFSDSGYQYDAFCNKVSRHVAEEYLKEEMSFLDADTIMNNLYSLMLEHCKSHAFPQPAFDIFSAFDAGEYHHRGDPEDSNAEELYTKPSLIKLMEGAKA